MIGLCHPPEGLCRRSLLRWSVQRWSVRVRRLLSAPVQLAEFLIQQCHLENSD
ncbi:hypothetical protein SynRCC2555_02153 [Synechococcus sp. WH 8101]|nr:hypothetical protein SynRCC2555_02153 [Synechococcus sp. WH 8101]